MPFSLCKPFPHSIIHSYTHSSLPTAKAPEEDRTKESCTLFEPRFERYPPNTIKQLVHVKTQQPLAVVNFEPYGWRYLLYLYTSGDEETTLFEFKAWEDGVKRLREGLQYRERLTIELESKLRDKDEEVEKLRGQVEGKDGEIGELREKVKAADAEIGDLKKKAAEGEGEIEKLKEKVAERDGKIGKLVKALKEFFR